MKMKTTTRTTALAAAAVAAALLSTAAHAGVVTYSLHTPNTTVAPGDTIPLTVHASIDTQGDPFVALASASFDVLNDDVAAGGTTDFTSPGLGLTPDFLSGMPGTLVGNDIMAVQPAQLPQFLNPSINTGTELDLYLFEYTVDDPTPRTITFDIANMTSTIYGNSMGTISVPYTSVSSPLQVNVSSVPAPGALALLGAAGLVGRRRRRRQAH